MIVIFSFFNFENSVGLLLVDGCSVTAVFIIATAILKKFATFAMPFCDLVELSSFSGSVLLPRGKAFLFATAGKAAANNNRITRIRYNRYFKSVASYKSGSRRSSTRIVGVPEIPVARQYFTCLFSISSASG